MLKLYLFIELLGSADAERARNTLSKLTPSGCTLRNVVQLSEDKLVAHVDCATGDDATQAVLQDIASVDGVVQTNIIAVVRPKRQA